MIIWFCFGPAMSMAGLFYKVSFSILTSPVVKSSPFLIIIFSFSYSLEKSYLSNVGFDTPNSLEWLYNACKLP